MADLQKIYSERFSMTGLDKRRRVWKILCRDFFDSYLSPELTVVDLACGYGEFINSVTAARRIAIDLNPDASGYLDDNVEFHRVPATELGKVGSDVADLLFTSNFLEHLKDKSECDTVFEQARLLLKPGGRFIVMGPNIRYAYREYWNYYDHYLPLSHLSLAEGLTQAGFAVERVIPRFLAYTMKSSLPTADLLIRAYLRMPFGWRFLGKQFLVVARKAA
jgi:SAM-dependent methyltransferase